jgi:hypothetical protein
MAFQEQQTRAAVGVEQVLLLDFQAMVEQAALAS